MSSGRDGISKIERVCFVLQLDPELRDEYLELHRDVWPELLDDLRRAGWCNYSLFISDDGLVVGYLEAADFHAARAAMDMSDANRRWQTLMGRYFTQLDGRQPDEGLVLLDEYFHLDCGATTARAQ